MKEDNESHMYMHGEDQRMNIFSSEQYWLSEQLW